MTPVKMSRLPDSVAPPKAPKPARTLAQQRADLERSLVNATSPLEIELKTRALAALVQKEQEETTP